MAGTPGGIHSEEELEALYESDSYEAFAEYLKLMEESEPPRIYLKWSLVAAAAALLGQHAIFRNGPNLKVTPNLFVVFLGPAGVRKTTAIRMMERFLESTSINFGPTSTGGQWHGLMSALAGVHRADYQSLRRHVDSGPITRAMAQPRRPSDMLLLAPELGRLFGSGNREIADFMIDLYDGAPIDYETKAGAIEIPQPLVTLLGATTPSSLATMIPENAGTHGILSRIIFVYADKAHKSVPLPAEENAIGEDLRERVAQKLHWIDNVRSDYVLAPTARELYKEVFYSYVPLLEDSRLEYYRERRANILLRVAMCIASLRLDTTIIDSDLRLAHEFLREAEPRMHRALEYFGTNRIFRGRMLIIEYLRATPDHAATRGELVAAASSDLKVNEAEEAIQTMLNAGELMLFGEQYVLADFKNEVLAQRNRKLGNKS